MLWSKSEVVDLHAWSELSTWRFSVLWRFSILLWSLSIDLASTAVNTALQLSTRTSISSYTCPRINRHFLVHVKCSLLLCQVLGLITVCPDCCATILNIDIILIVSRWVAIIGLVVSNRQMLSLIVLIILQLEHSPVRVRVINILLRSKSCSGVPNSINVNSADDRFARWGRCAPSRKTRKTDS